MNFKEQIKERQKLNRLLVKELYALVESSPTQRFGQILINYFFDGYGAKDGIHLKQMIFNEEPATTLATFVLTRELKNE